MEFDPFRDCIQSRFFYEKKKDFERASERADPSIDWKRLWIMPIVVRKGIYVESGIIMSIRCSLQIVETDLNHTIDVDICD